jgi:plasmid stabilization system protein ParE
VKQNPVIFTPEAKQQLDDLERYLAERFYPINAERFVQRLTKACISIGLAPYQGTRRDDIAPGLRTTGFESRVTIYFSVAGKEVLIVSILYGGREFH